MPYGRNRKARLRSAFLVSTWERQQGPFLDNFNAFEKIIDKIDAEDGKELYLLCTRT